MARCISFSKWALLVAFQLVLLTNFPKSLHGQNETDNPSNSDELNKPDMVSMNKSEQPINNNSSVQMTEISSGNSTLNENSTLDGNSTSDSNNTTGSFNSSSVASHKYPCKTFNITELPTTAVINNETEYQNIFKRMNTTHGCGMLLFYSPYCEFSVKLAPLYNALGRLYPNLAVMALDAHDAIGMAARYGVVGIPTVFFFYNGKAVARYNRSKTPDDFQKFIKDFSGYDTAVPFNITEEDRIGPIATIVKESHDYYMIFSISFLSIYIIWRLFGLHILNCIERVKTSVAETFTSKEKAD